MAESKAWSAKKKIELRRVFIVESPSPSDFFKDDREGPLLSGFLRILGIASDYRVCVDERRFRKALIEADGKNVDAIHLICHGDPDGIVLTNRRQLCWKKLAELAARHLFKKLLVISACQSASAELAEHFKRSPQRPGIIVGTANSPIYSDAALGWQLLYHSLSNGSTIGEALKKACAVDLKPVYRRWDRTRYRRRVGS